MKKVLIIAIALILLIQFGCGKTAVNNETAEQPEETAKNTVEQTTEAAGQTEDTEERPEDITPGKLELVLPPTIYAVVDKEVNIYYENIMNAKASDYQFDVTSEIGAQQSDRWTAAPPFAGEYDFKIDVYKDNSIVATASSKIVVTDVTAGEGLNKTCLVIGDSTTYYGITTGELLKLYDNDVSDITLIGSRGKNANFYEGISGFTVNDYLENRSSPFKYGGEFNLSEYMTVKGYNTLDYVIFNLGINDVFDFTDDESLIASLPSFMENYQLMVDKIKAYNSNIKIGVSVTIPPAASQDAFAGKYACKQTQFRVKRNNIIWNKALIAQFAGKEEQGIYLVPINVNIDTVNNYPAETTAINSRNETQIIRQSDGIHPAESGYYQIADSYYYFLKSLVK